MLVCLSKYILVLQMYNVIPVINFSDVYKFSKNELKREAACFAIFSKLKTMYISFIATDIYESSDYKRKRFNNLHKLDIT